MLTLFATLLLTLAPVGDDAVIAAQAPFYPLNTCVVSGEELGSMGDAIPVVADGRLFQVCCKGCIKKVHAETATFAEKLDAAVIAQQGAHYPLTTCPFSGNDLGERSISVVSNGRLIKVCCKDCAAKAEADPSSILPKLDAAWMASQRDSYPLETCPMSGEPLGDSPKEVLYGTQLVKLCCNMCVKKFNEAPAKVAGKVRMAMAAAHGGEHGRMGEHKGMGEHHEGKGEHGGRGEHEGHGEHAGRGEGSHEG